MGHLWPNSAGSGGTITSPATLTANNAAETPLTLKTAATPAAPVLSIKNSSNVEIAQLGRRGGHIFTDPTLDAGQPQLASGLYRAQQTSPDGKTDWVLGINHNWERNAGGTGWAQLDAAQASSQVTLEHWWNGGLEFNINQQSVAGVYRRSLGFVGQYDGTISVLQVGGSQYATGAAGVQLCGGTSATNQAPILLTQKATPSATSRLIECQRQDGTTNLAIFQDLPMISVALASTVNVNSGPLGVFNAVGDGAWGGVPIFYGYNIGAQKPLLAARALSTEAWDRFKIDTYGRLSWGGGAANFDLNLYRSGAGTLQTDYKMAAAEFSVFDKLRVRDGFMSVNGYLEYQEQAADPVAGSTNFARVYARDNGAGKTQMCVRFPTGAIQVLATEP